MAISKAELTQLNKQLNPPCGHRLALAVKVRHVAIHNRLGWPR